MTTGKERPEIPSVSRLGADDPLYPYLNNLDTKIASEMIDWMQKVQEETDVESVARLISGTCTSYVYAAMEVMTEFFVDLGFTREEAVHHAYAYIDTAASMVVKNVDQDVTSH